tara:strand:- start:1101 stop:1784 length:684 start_codon:yes stop_codon:yes gene_type:complete
MTVDTTEFTPEISEYIDEAYARCGVEYRTAYQLKSAIRSLNFILADWANRGLNRWTIEQNTQNLTSGQSQYGFSADHIDILSMVIRTDSGDTSKQSDTIVNRMSRSEFLNIPNKLQTGKPNQFYLDRDTTPILFIWPTPDSVQTYTLVFDVMKRIGHIDHTNESPDIPFRFYQCLASGLAYQLSLKFAPDRVGLLKQEYEEDFKRAADEDRDRARLKILPTRAYSRV